MQAIAASIGKRSVFLFTFICGINSAELYLLTNLSTLTLADPLFSQKQFFKMMRLDSIKILELSDAMIYRMNFCSGWLGRSFMPLRGDYHHIFCRIF